jgi:hypothetical protein
MGLLTWWRKSDDTARAGDAKIEDETRRADAKVEDEARAADAQMTDAGDKLELPAEGGAT